MRKFGFFILLTLGLTGCSTQNREAAPLADDTYVSELVADIRTEVGGKDPILNAMSDELLSDARATIFYHTKESSGVPASSIFSIFDMNALDLGWEEGVTSADIGMEAVDVVFMDSMDDEGSRVFSLMAMLQYEDGETEAYSFSSDPDDYRFTSKSFETYVRTADNQELILRSTDLSKEYNKELGDSVKLKIYLLKDGTEYYVGQISTMAGYGQR